MMLVEAKPLAREIATYLKMTGMSDSGFGEAAIGDKGFVSRLPERRYVQSQTAATIREFIARFGVPAAASASVPVPIRTGAELVAALEAEAARRGVQLHGLVKLLSPWPSSYLGQLKAARRPTAATCARIAAVIAGDAVPAAPPNNFQSPARAGFARKEPMVFVRPLAEPPVPEMRPFERTTCFWCGVRSDIGCAHLAPLTAEAA